MGLVAVGAGLAGKREGEAGEGGGRAHHAHPLSMGAESQDWVTSPYTQSRQHSAPSRLSRGSEG